MARKKANIHYIYKTTCNVTGKWYVGMHSTNNLEDGYMGSGTVLRHSIRKYGVENHTKEILEYLDSRELLVLREIEIVNNKLIGDGLCMNLKEGGNGGLCNDEHYLKFINAGMNNFHISRDKRDNTLIEKRKDIEWVKNQSINIKKGQQLIDFNYKTFEGKQHSDETKQLISEIKKGTGTGETNSQYGTCWITRDGVNKKVKKEELEIYISENWVKGRK